MEDVILLTDYLSYMIRNGKNEFLCTKKKITGIHENPIWNINNGTVLVTENNLDILIFGAAKI